jgi:4'-phosphopantetheinyl transferase
VKVLHGSLESIPDLRDSGIHVWKAGLDRQYAAEWGEEILSPEEIERAGRFRFGADRLRFLTGRIVLRLLSAAYTGVCPRELILEPDETGKLRLGNRENAGIVQFNHSHSGEVILLAFSRGRRVGVDVECLGRGVPYEEVLGPLLSPGERQ